MSNLPNDVRWAVVSNVREAVSKDPSIIKDIIDAATAGQQDHIDEINNRRSELERAWVTALLVMQAERITPGLKKMLLHSLVPVLERYGVKNECPAVRDAHAMAIAS